ncbi:MAG: response regulator [Pseudomonadota bacterium]
MNNILFVDDDSNILSGLRRRMRSLRPEWQTTFAGSGVEALQRCAETSFDVVVTDMRMPGMDGSTLLQQIQKSHPHAARIILSGFAEDEAVLRTVGPAHQYLAKPCEDDFLVKTIEHALELRGLLTKPELRSLVAKIDTLASPPDTYSRLLNALEDPKAGNDKIASIVSSDIALTAEVLKMTNSAYFSIAMKVTSVSHAVRMIGTETLKSLALFIGLFRSFEGSKKLTGQLTLLCNRSQQIGVTAALIAEKEGLDKRVCQMIPSTGMLSHIGSLVLYLSRPAEMEKVIAQVEQEGIPIIDAELAEFGAAHPEIGAYLLGLWGFPDPVVQAVAYHHRPMDVPHLEMTALTAIYAAQHLAKDVALQQAGKTPQTQIDMDYLASIGKANNIETWREIAATVHEKYETLSR